MQRVTKLVKHRRHFVERQQCRFARRRLRDIQVIRNDRLASHEVRLRHVGVHPRPAPFRRTRVHVGQEQPKRRTVSIDHFINPDVRMIDRQVQTLLEAQPVKPRSRVKHSVRQHIVHFEIWSELRRIERVTSSPYLFRVVGPIPARQRELFHRRPDHRLEIHSLRSRIRYGRRRQTGQPLVHRIDCLSCLPFKNVRCVVRVPEHLRALSAQPCHPRHDVSVIELSSLTASCLRRGHDALTERSVLQRGQRRLPARIEERDDVVALGLSRRRGLGGGRNLVF